MVFPIIFEEDNAVRRVMRLISPEDMTDEAPRVDFQVTGFRYPWICPHGLSLSLCEDNENHYRPDMPEDHQEFWNITGI